MRFETYMTLPEKNKEEGKNRIYNDGFIEGPDLVNEETDPVVLKKKEMARKRFENRPPLGLVLEEDNLL